MSTFQADASTAAGSVGAAADAMVADLNSQLQASLAANRVVQGQLDAANAANAALVATNADLAARLAADEAILHPAPPPPPPPPPPPVNHLCVGTSPGGNLTRALADFPHAEAARVFLGAQLPTKVADNADFALAVSKKLEVWVSWNTMPRQAQFQTVVADWIASGATIWWDYRHEVDAPKEAAPQFVTEYNQLQVWAEAVPGYAASKVRDQFILMAYVLDPSQPHGVPSSWYPKRPTRAGFDAYNKAAVGRVIAECKRMGWRYVFPELGCGGPNSEAVGDVAGTQWLKDVAAAWAGYPPEGFCFFASALGNNIGTPLTNMPLMVAELTALAAQ